jgi:hypothetical protein
MRLAWHEVLLGAGPAHTGKQTQTTQPCDSRCATWATDLINTGNELRPVQLMGPSVPSVLC